MLKSNNVPLIVIGPTPGLHGCGKHIGLYSLLDTSKSGIPGKNTGVLKYPLLLFSSNSHTSSSESIIHPI